MSKIQPLSQNDFPALFNFEQDNWDYFSQFIPSRPDTYRDYDSFFHAQNVLLMEQDAKQIAFFVLYDNKDSNKIIARVNLRDIENNSASLGYRISESVAGKGIATEIVGQVINYARIMSLKKLNAIVMTNNPASERVLIKNGFELSHVDERAYKFQDQIMDFRYFELNL